MTIQPGIPKKVLATAHVLGVHNDCLLVSKDEAESVCDECRSALFLSFDVHYGHISDSDAVMLAIVDDVLEDMRSNG